MKPRYEIVKINFLTNETRIIAFNFNTRLEAHEFLSKEMKTKSNQQTPEESKTYRYEVRESTV
jgi:hypothetical protein